MTELELNINLAKNLVVDPFPLPSEFWAVFVGNSICSKQYELQNVVKSVTSIVKKFDTLEELILDVNLLGAKVIQKFLPMYQIPDDLTGIIPEHIIPKLDDIMTKSKILGVPSYGVDFHMFNTGKMILELSDFIHHPVSKKPKI